jgi:flagellar hook protein FlgE
MGYQAIDGKVDTASPLAPIVINKGETIGAEATTEISMTANLDAQAEDGDRCSATIQVFDSLGVPHNISVVYTRTGAGEWHWTATVPAEDVGGSADDDPVLIGEGDLQFDENGHMTSPVDNPTLSITGLSSGASDMDITLMLVDDKGEPRITNYASESAVTNPYSNGYAAGVMRDISIGGNGEVVGLFDNGEAVPLAQLAIADFANVVGLERYRGGTFIPSTNSGEPSIGLAGSGGRGKIVGTSLEQSNVDIAQEFTNVIVAQRGYQANSRIITTTDELYQESLNIKR